MKTKLILRWTTCVILAVIFLPAQARQWKEYSDGKYYFYYECDTVIDGIAYRLDDASLKATVTFFSRKIQETYQGNLPDVTQRYEHNYGDLQYRGDVVIPEVVEFEGSTYTVTSIDTHAFDGCKEITDLQIPQSVHYDYTYWADDFLGEDDSWGRLAYWICRYSWGELFFSNVNSYDEKYYADPFPWLLDKPAGTVVYQEDEVALVVGQEWYETNSKRDGRKTVDVDAVQIREGATSIARRAAYKLSASHVVLPPSLEQVEAEAFLQSNIGDLAMDGVKTVGDSAFIFAQLENISLPNVEHIGNSVFRESTLKHISFNPNLKAIGDYAFCDCKQLTDVQLPDSLTTLGSSAFSGCTGLTDMALPNSLTAISGSAFYGCTSLANVAFPNSLSTIGNGAFYGCTSLKDVVFPNSLTSIGDDAFNGCTSLKDVVLPNSLTSIGDDAFNGCKGLTEIVIPYSVSTIGSYAFYGCNNLSNITVPCMTTRGLYAFPSQRETVTITGKGSGALSASRTVNIGCGITALGRFLNQQAEVVNCYAETPPECIEQTFIGYSSELHVPAGTMAAYFTAPIWENFTNLHADLTDKVTLELTEAQMLKGDELQLSGNTIPEGAALVWGTTDPAVAVVDASGKVTALGMGECDIYASLADNLAVYSACHIDVHNRAVITLPAEELTVSLNTIVTLTPMFDPEPTDIVATSSDPSVAIARIINAPSNGAAHAPVAGTKIFQVLGVKEGTATFTVASVDGLSVPATLAVTVIDHFPEGDVNCDRTVNGADVTALYNSLMGGEVGPAGLPGISTTHLDGTPVLDGDVNGDGIVNGSDVTALYNLLLN